MYRIVKAQENFVEAARMTCRAIIYRILFCNSWETLQDKLHFRLCEIQHTAGASDQWQVAGARVAPEGSQGG